MVQLEFNFPIDLYILGRPFQEKEPLLFYKYVSALSCEKDELFLHYCEAVAHNTEESKKAFLEYICSFPYEKLDRNSNNPYILFATKMLQDLFYDDFPLVCGYRHYLCFQGTAQMIAYSACYCFLAFCTHP